MSLYPSLEDMQVDSKAKESMTHEYARQFQVDAMRQIESQTPSTGGSLYSGLGVEFDSYAGMDISSQALERYMPHEEAYALAHQHVQSLVPSTGSSSSLPGSQAIASITPRNDIALQRSEIKQGLRQVILAKDGDGKLGLAVKAIDKGLFVAFVWAGKAASMAGIRFGDQIVQINGETVAGWKDQQAAKFLRRADASSVTLIIRDRPLCRTITLIKDDVNMAGFTFREGEIVAIVKDSSAARNGLMIHHQLVEVGGRNVVGLKDKEIRQIIQEQPRSVTLTIMPSFMYKHMVRKIGFDRIKKYMEHGLPEY